LKKKVGDEKNVVFLNHIGKDPNSFYKILERSCEDLINQSQHIQKVFDNQLHLKVSIDIVD
jgi:hypothetical protein